MQPSCNNEPLDTETKKAIVGISAFFSAILLFLLGTPVLYFITTTAMAAAWGSAWLLAFTLVYTATIWTDRLDLNEAKQRRIY